MRQKAKSQKRLDFMELISEAITQDDIFHTIDYKNKTEDQIKQFVYPHLVQSLTQYLVENTETTAEKAKAKVKRNLKWEGDVNTTVHHTLFMGTLNFCIERAIIRLLRKSDRTEYLFKASKAWGQETCRHR